MRKGRDGEKKMEWWKIMMKIVATNVVASRPPNSDRLQRRPLVPIEMAGAVWIKGLLGRSLCFLGRAVARAPISGF